MPSYAYLLKGTQGVLTCIQFRAMLMHATNVQGVRYQIVVMLLSLVCSALASTSAVFVALFTAMDAQHRLRTDRLLVRPGNQESGVATWLQAQTMKVFYLFWYSFILFLNHSMCSLIGSQLDKNVLKCRQA